MLKQYKINGICTKVICPTPLDISVRNEINRITKIIVENFFTKGIIAIEFFLTKDNKVLVNEISPRVHNSGHYTIEATNCSQFEQHIRSIVGLPNIIPYFSSECPIMMENILGTGNKLDYKKILTKSNLHWYNKKSSEGIFRLNRKIGHYTVKTNIIDSPYPLVYVIMGSISDYLTMKPAIDLLKYYHVPHKVDIVSAHRSPEWMFEFGRNNRQLVWKSNYSRSRRSSTPSRNGSIINSNTSNRCSNSIKTFIRTRFFIIYCSNAGRSSCCNNGYWKCKKCSHNGS